MTAPALLALITAALLLQLGAGIGWVVWRRRSAAGAAALPAAAAARTGPDTAWAGWRDFRVVHRQAEDPAASQCSFHLQPVDGLPLPAFQPGQFLTFSLDIAPAPSVGPAGGLAPARPVIRCYSLSDQPDPSHYRVTVKRVPAPAGLPGCAPGLSSNHFHDRVPVGDILRLKAPAGRFFIDPDPAVPVVLVGGGIGITPMMAMLRWCLVRQPQRQLHLFYGLRNSQEHAFKPVLEAMASAHPALHLHVVYSRPADGDRPGLDFQHTGHVDIDLLRRSLPHGRHQFYVCGPPAMMQTLVPALADWGVPVADIHFEAFGPATVLLPGAADAVATAATGVELQFQKTGRTLAWDGQDASLLDFAERHGIAVPSGCRSGGCGSCETRLLSGDVQYDHPPDHSVAPGHCLLCVGRPLSPLVLDA